jgi:hypothetical protein
LSNDCQAGLDQVGKQDVVEPDKGDLLVKTEPSQAPLSTDGDEVLCREQSSMELI